MSSVAVIGGGMFGAMAALRLRRDGHSVTLFERERDLLMGASLNNQNRLHLGYHYPRDMETARQCVAGFERFRAEFPGCFNEGFTNAYFVASLRSLTTADEYMAFAEALGFPYRRIEPCWFRPEVRGVSCGIEVREIVYDVAALRMAVKGRMLSAGVVAVIGRGINSICRRGISRFAIGDLGEEMGGFDAVINCTYSDIGRLSAQLGHAPPERQFEYTAVAIVALDLPPVGITIMDGRFMTLLPYGNTGHFLLYHVDHAVIASEMATQMPAGWMQRETSPASKLDRWAWFSALRDSCKEFVPCLEKAGLVGILEGPRMVLAKSDSTDPRPSFLEEPEPGYFTVFAGKIDHSIWIADEIAKRVSKIGVTAA